MKLCVTHSGTTHLTFTCEMRSPNCPVHFGQLENGSLCILFGMCLVYVSARDFDSITQLFSDTPGSGVCSENSGVMLPKSRVERTWGYILNNMQRLPFLGGFRTYPS